MTVTIHSPFVSEPRISRSGFITVLERSGSFTSPALWGEYPETERPHIAGDVYDVIVEEGGDPAVELATCGREHTFGTNESSVLWRSYRAGEPTYAWGNQRSVRHPGIESAGMWNDPERDSQYARFRNVKDAARDAVYRVKDPSYAYAGATSIAEVIAIWAPSSDNNNPDSFAHYIADQVTAWSKEFPPEQEQPMAAQIPGFKWHPAARTHYSKGRTQKIRGFAIHYTAGTDSLDWLSGTSSPPVSSTFLIKHNPTLEDRGWQLVAIEDTPWTTGDVNPFTVSSEYEHTGGPVSDAAYEVQAQTVADTAEYVTKHKLGEIPLTRNAVKGHSEWVGGGTVCPDGISVDRVVDEIKRKPDPEPRDPCTYYPATGFYACSGFRGFHEDNGSVPIFGYPLSREFRRVSENGNEVVSQWYERALFEWQPDIADNPHGVVLARLGSDARKQDEDQYPEAFEPQEPPE